MRASVQKNAPYCLHQSLSIGKPASEGGKVNDEMYAQACTQAARSFATNVTETTIQLATLQRQMAILKKQFGLTAWR